MCDQLQSCTHFGSVSVWYVHVVFIYNVPVRFVNQLKLKGLSRSHPVHVATAAVVASKEKKSVVRFLTHCNRL